MCATTMHLGVPHLLGVKCSEYLYCFLAVLADDCSGVGVSPVCTPMGQTLRHSCHANERWAGSELTDGSCEVQDACKQHHCPTGSRCVGWGWGGGVCGGRYKVLWDDVG